MIPRLKKRAQFVEIAKKGARAHAQTLLVQTLENGRDDMQAGFTVTKKTGNAVVRNRIRRRLREAVKHLLPQQGRPGHDYVFIGKEPAYNCTYDIILRDMKYAIRKVHS